MWLATFYGTDCFANFITTIEINEDTGLHYSHSSFEGDIICSK